MKLGLRTVILPVPDALNIDAQFLCNVDLAQSEIEATLLDVITQGLRVSDTRRNRGILGT